MLKKKNRDFKNFPIVQKYLRKEIELGVNNIKFYRNFQNQVEDIITKLNKFIKKAKVKKFIVAGYGAAAKSTVIINSAKLTNADIKFVVDKNPYNKQNTFVPGTNIPIVDEKYLRKTKPNLIIIFPWNIKNEIITQLDYVREWEANFAVCIPKVKVLKK